MNQKKARWIRQAVGYKPTAKRKYAQVKHPSGAIQLICSEDRRIYQLLKRSVKLETS